MPDRIPLLLAANPRHCKNPAEIPVVAGKWKIHLEDVVDSGIHIMYHRSPDVGVQATHGYVIALEENVYCRAKVTEPGTEPMISVFLEQVEDEA